MARVTGAPLVSGPEMLQENWLRCFCKEEESRKLAQWLNEEGLARPRKFKDRLAHSEKLEKMADDWCHKEEYQSALRCILGAMHALDFTPSKQLSQSESKLELAHQAMLPILSKTSMVFLKLRDVVRAQAAASQGLQFSKRFREEDTAAIRAKLLIVRGLARVEPGPLRDLKSAKADFAEAARLDPNSVDLQASLETCELLEEDERKRERERRCGRPASPKKGPPQESPLSPKKAPPQESAAVDGGGAREAEKKERPERSAYRHVGPRSNPQEGASADDGERKREDDGMMLVAEEPGLRELSPFAEKFAQVAGTCLGRTRRRLRHIWQGSTNWLLEPIALMPVIIPLVGPLAFGLLYPPSDFLPGALVRRECSVIAAFIAAVTLSVWLRLTSQRVPDAHSHDRCLREFASN